MADQPMEFQTVNPQLTLDRGSFINHVFISITCNMVIQQCYCSIMGQDHRAIKQITRPMLGFKSFWSVAAFTLAGIELMHMIRKSQPAPIG